MLSQRKFWSRAKIRLLAIQATDIEYYFGSDRCRNIDTVLIEFIGNENWEQIPSLSEINDFFYRLAEYKLRELSIEDSELKAVSPKILAKAIGRLEKISITSDSLSAGLTSAQLTSIFEIIAKCEDNKLRHLDLSVGRTCFKICYEIRNRQLRTL